MFDIHSDTWRKRAPPFHPAELRASLAGRSAALPPRSWSRIGGGAALALSDTLAALLATGITLLLMSAVTDARASASVAIMQVPLFIFCSAIAGLYSAVRQAPVARVRARCIALMIAAGLYGGIILLTRQQWIFVAVTVASAVMLLPLAYYADLATRSFMGTGKPFSRDDAVAALALPPGPAVAGRTGIATIIRHLAKRAFDLALALPLMILALPVLVILIIAVKCIDPGPAIYIQTRVGRGGRSIPIYKIRSMFQDAEMRLAAALAADADKKAEWQRCFKLSNDPRVLPGIGLFMRRMSLDELPQLWNIIRGDMSIVGPRPFPAYHLRSFDAEFQALRSSVTPGLTGLWQVVARSDSDLTVQQALDTRYVAGWSIWLELYILLETLPAVLTCRGAR